MEDSPETATCKHCKKSFLKSVIKGHVDGCLAARKEAMRKKKEIREGKEKAKRKDDDKDKEKEKEKAKSKEKKAGLDEEGDPRVGNDDDEDEDAEADETPDVPLKKPPAGLKSAKKSAGKKTDTADGEKKGKKRKADGDAEKGPKQKKKKEEPKPKAPKPKGPVDVERQCGVITPNGVPCARSLTCKSHSMGAKRAVPGRSLPYDMLLAAYQKKNQAKQQKAAIDANAPLEDEDDANAGPVDSDEEAAAVMAALSKWNPRPLVPQPIMMPIKRRYQRERLREQLDNATSGGTVNIFKVVSKNGIALPLASMDVDDAPGEPDYGIAGQGSRRPSGAFALQQQQQLQRRASQASRA
ncbi:MAG: hypothetical protein M1818_003773 [Claussenomyces sp. TS43310]|nr:MAG: hypothetical protein M1818_003773 [Claussenomyces sp. TS43310]